MVETAAIWWQQGTVEKQKTQVNGCGFRGADSPLMLALFFFKVSMPI